MVKPATLDLQSLLIPEVRAFLVDAGIGVELHLSDALGRSLDDTQQQSVGDAVELYSKRRERERRLVDLGELGAGVTHEARNVIAGVLGLAQLGIPQAKAETDSAPSEQHELRPHLSRTLETIARESARCVDLLNNYLSFASQREPSAQVVGILSLVDPVVQLTAHEAKVRRCSIDVQISPDLPAIVVRAAEMRDVILNLVINALHAIESDGVIRISADRLNKEYIRIRVADSGPGVPDALKEKIFERFFSTKPQGLGTGIGLALALKTVVSHGGSLDVRDGENGGAEFVILLPVEQDVYSISERAPVRR